METTRSKSSPDDHTGENDMSAASRRKLLKNAGSAVAGVLAAGPAEEKPPTPAERRNAAVARQPKAPMSRSIEWR